MRRHCIVLVCVAAVIGASAQERVDSARVASTCHGPASSSQIFQHFTGKPWAASTRQTLPQGDLRILREPPGSRRLSSQTLLDLRLSRTLRFGSVGRVELLMDVLNLLNDTAEEGLASDNLFSSTFGQPTVFMNPRRVMLGGRLHLGR